MVIIDEASMVDENLLYNLFLGLNDNCKIVMEKAISLGGTTIKSFTSSEGVHGLFQNELLVHGRDKGMCPNCSNQIKKVKIGGRGTYYCEKCQK